MTNGGLAARARSLRLGPSQRIMLLTGTVAAAAVALFVIVVRPLPTAPTALTLPWVLWALAFALSEALEVHVQWNRESHTFSATDLVLACGLLLTSPTTVVTAQVVGVGITMMLRRRQFGLKLAFNLAEYALCGCLAVLADAGVVHLLGESWSWIAALAGVALCTTTAGLCLFAVMTLLEERLRIRSLGELLGLSVPFTMASAVLGVVLARSAVHDPAAVALLALPSILIVAAYRAYTRAREQQENMRLLHEVTSLLHSRDSHEALDDFLTSIRSAFRAEMAELVLMGGSGQELSTVSRSSDGAAPLVMAALERPQEHTRLLDLVTAAGAVRSRVGSRQDGGPLDAYAAAHGCKDAMVAILRTEDRVHGLLLVAGRLGDATTFSSSDVALLETFGRYVATSLERGRLEETLRQVTDLKEQLRHQALHDGLTGLPNRTLFLDRARQAVESAERSGAWPAVLYIDLDGFKPVNDAHGHEAGDVLLRAVANRIAGCLRPSDTAARLGGDEFAVLLSGPTEEDAVRRVLERLRSRLEVPVDLGEGRITTVGMSVGVAVGLAGLPDADALIRQADIAMYAAKRGGGHTFLFYEPSLGDARDVRKDAEGELAAAIRDGQLRVVYQPLFDVRSGRPTGAEALVRWQHPVDGMRGPDSFIGLAEESGLITELGLVVLRDACRQAARWVRSTPDPQHLLVTVNLSARQLADPEIVAQVAAALTEAGLEPHRLVLEITETVLMQDRDAAAATLWQLKALGVRIAIDDFGTGYSSLAYLRRFPIDMLKVAREFVDGLGRDANDDAITQAIVELAATLGMLTVAEGIETVQQQEHVARLGCDIVQGYLLSRPVAADAVAELLAELLPAPGLAPLPVACPSAPGGELVALSSASLRALPAGGGEQAAPGSPGSLSGLTATG